TLHTQVNAHKAAHRRRVVQLLLDRRVREVEPQLQEVNPQHALERYRWPATLFTDLRIYRRHRRRHLWPRNDAVHVGQELRAARGLAVLLKPGQRLLLHRAPRCETRSCIRMTRKSEFP